MKIRSWLAAALLSLPAYATTPPTFSEAVQAPHLLAAEGEYEITFDDGDHGIFNVIFVQDNNMVAGFGTEREDLFLNFFYVGYDGSTNTFSASEHDRTDSAVRNLVIHFRVTGDTIVGALPSKNASGGRFRGVRIRSYPNLLGNPRVAHSNVQGTYEGRLQCGESLNETAVLYVDAIQGYLRGRIAIGPRSTPSFFVNFSEGLQADVDKTVYLTSRGAWPDRSFVHIRGQLDGEHLRGQYLIGGVRNNCEPLDLVRVTRTPF